MRVTNPGILRTPIPHFLRFYRIIERKCRIIRGFFLLLLWFLRRRIQFSLWECIGQYQQRVGEGDVVLVWHGFWIINRAIFRSPEIYIGGGSQDRVG